MDGRQNARLTVWCRELVVERVQAGRPKAQVARELGVSTKTVTKWLRRFREHGPQGLQDRSCRPRCSPMATDEILRTAVVALRRQRMTLIAIATQLGLSRATVARIAKAAGLNRLSKLEPAPVYRRYERAEAGELLHLDVKKLGRIVKVGHRITGDRTTRDRWHGSGWEYLHIGECQKFCVQGGHLGYGSGEPIAVEDGELIHRLLPFLRGSYLVGQHVA